LPRPLPQQQSYLLRLWPAQVEGKIVWRAYLMRIPDGVGQGFPSLARLLEYLETQFDKVDPETPSNEAQTDEFEEQNHEK